MGNVTHDNEDSGINIYPGGNNTLATSNVTYNNGDHGIDDLNVTGGRLIGNTVFHNCTSGINVEGTSGSYVVENNVAVDNAVYPAYNGISCSRRAGNIGIWDSAPATTTVDHNLVYLSKPGTMYVFKTSYTSLAAMSAATGQEKHGVQGDPRFANAAAANFTPLAGSPAIDRNSSASRVNNLSIGREPARRRPGNTEHPGRGTAALRRSGRLRVPGTVRSECADGAAERLSVEWYGAAAGHARCEQFVGSAGAESEVLLRLRGRLGVGRSGRRRRRSTYTSPGSYTVTVTVTDTAAAVGDGEPGGDRDRPECADGAAERVALEWYGAAAGHARCERVRRIREAESEVLLRLRGRLGVGSRAAPTAQRTYTSPGSYTVTPTVTDTAGLSATASQAVTATTAGGVDPTYVGTIANNYSTTTHTSGSVTV
jgi:hypothetical protein